MNKYFRFLIASLMALFITIFLIIGNYLVFGPTLYPEGQNFIIFLALWILLNQLANSKE